MHEYSRDSAGAQVPRGKRHYPFRDGAAYYRDRGWTGVIPVARTGTKAPLVKGVTGHQGLDATDEEMTSLLLQYPQANLGLRLPWDFIGIDVDAYEGRDGHNTIMRLVDRLGRYLPLTWRSTSRMPEDGVSGIYLFHAPRTAQQVWVTDLGPGSGVEIAQYHHRFATVAPSIHNSTGRQYRWWRGDDPVTIPRPDELPDLPEEWVRYLLSARDYATTSRTGSAEAAEWYARVSSGRMCKYMARSSEQEATKIRVAAVLGGLHDVLCSAVTHVCMNAAEGHRGLDEALSILEWDFSHSARHRNLKSEWAGAVNTAMANAAAMPQEETDVCSLQGTDWRKMS